MDVLPQLSIEPEQADEVPLDLRDKKILSMLSRDARMPLSKIAKTINLSRDSVKYRLDSYYKSGVLRGTVTVVNASKLGYDAYHIFLRLNSPSKDVEKSIISKISAMPFVRAVLKFFGNYDLEVAVVAKNLSEFDTILTSIMSQAGRFIKEYEIMIIISTYVSGPFPKGFYKGTKQDMETFKIEKPKDDTYVPDAIDFKIIKRIRDDARLPLADIAQTVGLSTDAVSYRIKRMMENIIISFNLVTNYKRLGYAVHALLLNISPLDAETEKRLRAFLSNNDNVLWAVKTIGRFNVLTYICTKNESELQELINQLREEFSEKIKSNDSLLAFEEYKYTYAPDCLFAKVPK